MKKVFLIFFCVLLLTNHTGVSAKEPDIGCICAVLIDADSGRVLYEKNAEEERAMASTTKIMTCIIALEQSNLNDLVTVSRNATRMPKVKMYIKQGEQYRLGDLLYALMLESYNDVAVAVAEHIGGSVKGFAKRMNQKAKELGLTHTHFVTPNGLDADQHYSTAKDMALLGAYAIKKKQFLDIVNQKTYQIKEQKNGRVIRVSNKDAYLSMDADAIGIKTGFTNRAGYCFVGAVKQGTSVFTSCVLASGWPPNKNQKYTDTKKLMTYGKKHFKKDLLKVNREVVLNIKNGKFSRFKAKIQGEKEILKQDGENYRFVTKYSYKLPIKEKQVIGYTNVYIGDFCFGSFQITAAQDVPIYDYQYCLYDLVDRLLP